MENILPVFKSFSLDGYSWNRLSSFRKADIETYAGGKSLHRILTDDEIQRIESQTKRVGVKKTQRNKVMYPRGFYPTRCEENSNALNVEISPLSIQERGVADKASIQLPDQVTITPRFRFSLKNPPKKENFRISLFNDLPYDIDLVLQRSFSIQSSPVSARDNITRLFRASTDMSEIGSISILLSKSDDSLVTVYKDQKYEQMIFSHATYEVTVKESYGQILVTRESESTEGFALNINDIIVSVNGKRILSKWDYNNEVKAAKRQHIDIIICAICIQKTLPSDQIDNLISNSSDDNLSAYTVKDVPKSALCLIPPIGSIIQNINEKNLEQDEEVLSSDEDGNVIADPEDEVWMGMLARRTVGSNKRMSIVQSVLLDNIVQENTCDDDEDSHWRFATQQADDFSPSKYLVKAPFCFIPSSSQNEDISINKANGVIVNCSSKLELSVYIVTIGGLLILKQVLLPGDICPILILHEKVYLLSASQLPKVARANRNDQYGQSNETVTSSALIATLHISESLLDTYHKLSCIWMPSTSLSISRNGRLRRASSSGLTNMVRGVHSLDYAFQFQVLDSAPHIETSDK